MWQDQMPGRPRRRCDPLRRAKAIVQRDGCSPDHLSPERGPCSTISASRGRDLDLQFSARLAGAEAHPAKLVIELRDASVVKARNTAAAAADEMTHRNRKPPRHRRRQADPQGPHPHRAAGEIHAIMGPNGAGKSTLRTCWAASRVTR
jgi:hypothetical protein